MNSRMAMTGSAFAVALLVLVLTLIIGREPRVEKPQADIEPIAPTLHTAPQPDAGSLVKSITDSIDYKQRTEDGQIISVQAETYEPMPDGRFETEQPRIGLMLKDQRLIELRADRARLLAPDHKPRSGTFAGNVMLLLAESGDGRPKPFSADPDLAAMKCFIDGEVHFDRELGSVKSDSFVNLTTPRVEATGWGLRLSYNMADNVLNKLAGMRNGTLRFRRRAEHGTNTTTDSPQTQGEPVGRTSADDAPAQYYRATFHDRVVIHNKFATIEAEELQIVFQYEGGRKDGAVLNSLGAALHELEKGTHVVLAKQPLNRSGEKITAPCFSYSSAFLSPGFSNRAKTVLMQIVVAALASQSVDERPPEPSNLPAREYADETTIKWHGVLTVVPIDQPQSEEDRLAGSNDAFVTLHGRPVHVRTPKHQTVTAASIDYLVSSERLRASGVADEPLLIESPDMGVVVRAASLEINQSKGTGWIDGPASLQSLDQTGPLGTIRTDSPWARWDSRMPAGASVRWADRLELSFYKGPAPGKATDATSPISGLRNARFAGNVQIDSPGFEMKTDHLRIGMDEPAEGNRQSINKILAEGHVSVQATVQDNEESLQVQSDRLEVALRRQDDGTVQPTRLIASSGGAPVTASSNAGRLSAGRLEVFLHHVDSDTESEDAEGDESRSGELFASGRGTAVVHQTAAPKFVDIATAPLYEENAVLDRQTTEPAYVPSPSTRAPAGRRRKVSNKSKARRKIVPRTVIAEHDVIIDLADPAAQVTAARVVADVEAQRVELYGNDEQLAKAEQADGTLIGHYMVITQASETLRIMGPGRALFYEQSRPIVTRTDDAPDHHAAAILDVTWHDRMFFDHCNGLAQFTGNVVIRSELKKDTVQLSGDDFRVEFTRSGRSTHRGDDQSASALERLKHSKRSVHSMAVVGKMRFLAENWLDRPGNTLASSVLIQGPQMQYDGTTEQIRVPGRGSMTFVDRRPETAGTAGATETNAAANPIVAFSGRGNTLFEWIGDLTLDARRNDVTMRNQVRMTHLSAGKDEVLMMDCRRLLADLEATGGVRAWMGENVPRPDITAVVADGDVRIQHGNRSIHTDQLKYTGTDEQVVLTAKPGRLTQVGGGDNFSARAILWNLRTDRFEARDLGAVRFAP